MISQQLKNSKIELTLQKLVILLLAAILLALGLTYLNNSNKKHGTAFFQRSIGIHPGDSVEVLGIKVGSIDAITPQAAGVKVEFNYDLPQALPADVKAVITSPSIVPVRTLMLGPLKSDKPGEFPDGGVIPMERTGVPLEWDEIKAQVLRLSSYLGPRGANQEGTLAKAIRVAENNFRGKGSTINQTIQDLAKTMKVLANSKQDIFGTIKNLRIFVDALAKSNVQIFEFNKRLATTAEILNNNSKGLSKALLGLSTSFKDLQKFLKNNRVQLKETLSQLRPISKLLKDNRKALAEVIHLAPTAISNLYNIYEPINGSITGAMSIPGVSLVPAQIICGAVVAAGGSPAQCATALAPLVQLATFAAPGAGITVGERNGRKNQVDARRGPEVR